MNTVKTRAVLNLEKRNVPRTLRLAKGIHAGVSGAPAMFPAPPVAMSTFLAQIEAVDAAEGVVTSTRATGSATTRDDKVEALASTCTR